MKITKSVVTGGAGFIGSNLTNRLLDMGHKVIVLDNFVSGKNLTCLIIIIEISKSLILIYLKVKI